MTRDEVAELFEQINVWKRGAERAPHKPLLALLALARCSRGEARLVPYREIEELLARLLREFGPPRRSVHPHYPFWWLQSDKIWGLSNAGDLEYPKGHSEPKRSSLVERNVAGGFPEAIYDLLRKDPALMAEVAGAILDKNFPKSLHAEILNSVGLELARSTPGRAKRDPAFRPNVIRAYEHKCAICGYDVQLGSADLAIDAAHIMWHQAGGPDTEDNGLALCTIHHKLLDRGALTISTARDVLVSEHVHGSSGLQEWLMRFHGQPINLPQNPDYYPDVRYLEWHQCEVFRAPAKHVPDVEIGE